MTRILNVMGGISPNALDATVRKIRRYFENHQVTTVIFDEPDEEVRRAFADAGIDCQFLRGSLKMSTIRLANHLSRRFRYYDMIHIYGSPVNHGPAAAVVSTVTGVPLVSRFNGYDLTSVANGRLTKRAAAGIARYLFRNSDAVVFNSCPQMIDLLDQYGVERRDYHEVIPPGVVEEWFAPASADRVDRLRQSLAIDEGTDVVGAVMTPRPVKRLDRMFDMVEAISEARDVVLVVVGESDYNDKYRREAESRGIDYHVRWAGHRHATELSQFYSLFDVTVMTSESESFGLSITESYLCETPCVAFDIGGMSEQIEHRRTGYLAPPGDVESFSEYVALLLDDTDRHCEFATEGKEYVRERFILRRVEERYSELIDRLVD